jgi:hypothetical protein
MCDLNKEKYFELQNTNVDDFLQKKFNKLNVDKLKKICYSSERPSLVNYRRSVIEPYTEESLLEENKKIKTLKDKSIKKIEGNSRSSNLLNNNKFINNNINNNID